MWAIITFLMEWLLWTWTMIGAQWKCLCGDMWSEWLWCEHDAALRPSGSHSGWNSEPQWENSVQPKVILTWGRHQLGLWVPHHPPIRSHSHGTVSKARTLREHPRTELCQGNAPWIHLQTFPTGSQFPEAHLMGRYTSSSMEGKGISAGWHVSASASSNSGLENRNPMFSGINQICLSPSFLAF